MKLKPLAATAAMLCLASAANAQQPALRIYSGLRDTLRTAATTVVAVTEPGATATINGTPAHVYKTGSFGAAVDLQPGQNTVTVTATKNGQTATVTRQVFRAEPVKAKAQKPQLVDPEATTLFSADRYVVTTPGAYLQYGNGDDRLGGSKMGFLDPGITLRVIGQKGGLYCVRLAADRIAYIPKSYTEPATTVTSTVNTGSWSLTNTGRNDRVSVALPHRLAYHYMTQLEPNVIMVDLFGATDNSNWITQRTLDLGVIDHVDFRQLSDDVYRVLIYLKGANQWGFKVGYDEGSNTLNIDVRHAPKSLKLRDLTIGLDAGHGGPYPGAISPSGIKEKDVNLDIVNRLKAILEKKGARIVMTRDGDTGPSMGERKRIWAAGNVDLAISIHYYSGGSPLASPGTATLYKHTFCRPLNECVLSRILETGLPMFGLVGNFNFSLNGPTLYPNCLVEGMFMSSLQEEEKLADPKFRQLFAEKIAQGIEDYLSKAAASRR